MFLKCTFYKRKLILLSVWMRHVILINLLLLLCGCEFTHYDWKMAFSSKAKYPTIYGIVHDETPSGAREHIILQYKLPEQHTWGPDYSSVYVAIPLNKGKAGYPLQYEGPICAGSDMEKVAPRKQLEDVSRHTFYADSIKTAKTLLMKDEVQKVNEKGVFSSNYVDELFSYSIGSDGKEVSMHLIPYWFHDPRIDIPQFMQGRDFFDTFSYSDLYSPHNRRTKHSRGGDVAEPTQIKPPRLRNPDGILLVPSEQKRPASDRWHSCMWAVVKAPVDVCVDVAMLPIYFLLFAVYR